MIARISSTARSSAPRIPRICLSHQSRGYKNHLWRKPETFRQTIVLTDGSSFTVMNSSPRKLYRLTRDKFNNALWTGRKRSAEEDEQNQQLHKFRRSYKGGIGSEEGMKQLLDDAERIGGKDVTLTGDAKVDAVDLLFKMMEHKDAYVPTKGREAGNSPSEPSKRKGVRT